MLHEGAFITDHHTGAEITLGMVICTYKRKDCILQHTDKLRKSLFFRPESDLYGKLLVCIVDNASELPRQDEGLLRLVHHPNTGGSGGFARGMQELRRISEEKKISHVILMDDDAEVTEESLYRLYALLAMARGSCRERPVSGRMFRMDLRQVQYTAAEVWNGGDLRHIGYSCDMTDPEALPRMNDPGEAQYGGWWFCCYPMSFVKDNDPLFHPLR